MYPSLVPLPTIPLDETVAPPQSVFYHEFYGINTMLSQDKLTSCSHDHTNTTITINALPGATIISPICLSLAGIAGHVVALFHLHRATKPNHSKTVFYVFLTTLIWTDLIGKLITTPPAIVSYAYGHWVGGRKVCHLHGYCMILIDCVTHFLVSSMALDRFVCVRYCYLYKSAVTKSRARTLLMSIWLFCLVFCSLPLFGVGEFEAQYPGTWCFINIHVGADTPWHHRLYTNIFGLMNIINIFIISFCNIMVIGILLSARISRNRKLSASSSQTQRSLTQKELEVQMSIVLLVITIVFLVSWSPLDFRLFLNQIWPHTCRGEHYSDLVAVRLASFNQIIDPWVYIICRRVRTKVFTSKVWKSCRSTLIGKNLSSKRNRPSVDLPPTVRNVDKDGATDSAIKEDPRKSSPATPEKQILSFNASVVHVNETCSVGDALRTLKNMFYKMGRRTDSTVATRSFQEPTSLENGSNYVCRKIGICKKKWELPQEVFVAASVDASSRKQFRVCPFRPSDLSRFRPKKLIPPKTSQSYTFTALEESLPESDQDYDYRKVIIGRRHSWSCSHSSNKHFRTRSTQTLEFHQK